MGISIKPRPKDKNIGKDAKKTKKKYDKKQPRHETGPYKEDPTEEKHRLLKDKKAKGGPVTKRVKAMKGKRVKAMKGKRVKAMKGKRVKAMGGTTMKGKRVKARGGMTMKGMKKK